MDGAWINGLPLIEYLELKSDLADFKRMHKETLRGPEFKLYNKISMAIWNFAKSEFNKIEDRSPYVESIKDYIKNASVEDVLVKMDEKDVIITFKNVVKD